MAQLQEKVNHYGKTNVGNFYKNQQITNRLDPVIIPIYKISNCALLANSPKNRVFGRFRVVRGGPKKRGLDRLGYGAGLQFGPFPLYLIRVTAVRMTKIGCYLSH